MSVTDLKDSLHGLIDQIKSSPVVEKSKEKIDDIYLLLDRLTPKQRAALVLGVLAGGGAAGYAGMRTVKRRREENEKDAADDGLRDRVKEKIRSILESGGAVGSRVKDKAHAASSRAAELWNSLTPAQRIALLVGVPGAAGLMYAGARAIRKKREENEKTAAGVVNAISAMRPSNLLKQLILRMRGMGIRVPYGAKINRLASGINKLPLWQELLMASGAYGLGSGAMDIGRGAMNVGEAGIRALRNAIQYGQFESPRSY